MKKYSDWLKIDLHLHTDFSKKTKENDYQGNFSVETLHRKMTENNVSIFSLTDHNIINIPAYTEYYSNFTGENDPLLLVGVELDIEVTVQDAKIYHSLLIFNYSSIEKAQYVSDKIEAKYTAKGLADKERKLTIDEVIELFPEDDFFFIPHAGNTKSIVAGYKGSVEDAQKMVLLMQSAFEKVPEKARQKYNEGFDTVLEKAFQNKDDMAYIQFSDNHNIEQYPKTHKGGTDATLHEFYYIKGSKNYETLRLAFIDPKSRIKSKLEYESINHLNNTIDKLKFENEGTLEDNEVFFSPHLNVIIGGRSSGKSLLMNLLGTKIDKVSIDNKYRIDDSKVLVKAKSDDSYKEKTSITHELIYINQGDIVKYFEEGELKDLAHKLGESEEYNSSKTKFELHKTTMTEAVEDLIDSYELAFDIGEDKKYELHKTTIEKIFSEEYVLKFDIESVKEKYDTSVSIDEGRKLIKTTQINLVELKQKEILNYSKPELEILDSFEKLLIEKLSLMDLIEKNNIKKNNFIDAVNLKTNSINSSLTSGAQEKSQANEYLRKLKDEIKNRFERMVNLKENSKKLEEFNYEMIEKIKLNEDISLVLEVEKESHIKSLILDGINDSINDKSLYHNLLCLLQNKITIKNLPNNTHEKLKQKINRQLEPIESMMDNPKDYLEYQDGTSSKDKSPGFNSEKYLEIVLKNEFNKMIFIDQPEDNLGNRFISDTLVNIIRDIKFQKQIFLVTHNPAVAVYGDAECIVIAENNENKISYRQIVLEDKDAQKEICSILDGGEYIFDNRSRKYNIQRILREQRE